MVNAASVTPDDSADKVGPQIIGVIGGEVETLRDAGLRVRYNQPYSGIEGLMYAVQRHGSHHCLPCIELEFNQRLFDVSARLPALAAATARALRRGLKEL